MSFESKEVIVGISVIDGHQMDLFWAILMALSKILMFGGDEDGFGVL